MFLAADEQRLDLIEAQTEIAPSGKWDDFPISTLSHHGAACCDAALEWLAAMDFALLNGAGLLSGPRWLRDRYKWGPSAWPIHWCEAVEEKILDCGAHSALAGHLFKARGVACFRVQLIQQYDRAAVDQWRAIWSAGEASSHWLDGNRIYHEGNAVLIDGDRIKLWDGSAGCWISPGRRGGYGSLLSLRIFGDQDRQSVRWEGRQIALNQWIHLAAEPALNPIS